MPIEKCVKCKCLPKVVKICDMYYVQCQGACKKWDKYFFLGLTEKSAIEQWNLYNRPMKRGGNPINIDDL